MPVIYNINVLLTITLFRICFSLVLFEGRASSVDHIYQSFCVAKDNMTVTLSSYTNVSTRKPGEISKQKCIRYRLCGSTGILNEARNYPGIGMHAGFLSLIAGGLKTPERKFPHMTLVGYEYKGAIAWNCGGSLVSESFVLTAAHCLHDSEFGFAKVIRLGITKIQDTTNLQEVKVKELIYHPEYTTSLSYHDIGLLKLSEQIYLNDYVRPACLHLEKDIERYRPIVTGWGDLYKDSGEGSDHLLEADLEFFDVKQCNSVYKKYIKKSYSKIKHGIKHKIMICAGSATAVKDVCEGDSGGPLQISEDDVYFIIGITALGKPCGLSKNNPGIYTKVSSYLQWIEDHVWPE